MTTNEISPAAVHVLRIVKMIDQVHEQLDALEGMLSDDDESGTEFGALSRSLHEARRLALSACGDVAAAESVQGVATITKRYARHLRGSVSPAGLATAGLRGRR